MKDLFPGEVICPKCEGTGVLSDRDFPAPAPTCDKCWGTGTLDWIDIIMGKPKPHRKLKGNWSIKMEQDLKAFYHIDLEQHILDSMGKEVVDAIDKEIIKGINLKIERQKLI